MKQVQISDRTIEVDGRRLRLDYPVKDAFCEGDRILVLFEPDAASKTFPNLVCFDLEDARIWEAELPDPRRQDVYYRVSSWRPLVVNSFSSYKVEIDPASGRIVGKEFVK